MNTVLDMLRARLDTKRGEWMRNFTDARAKLGYLALLTMAVLMPGVAVSQSASFAFGQGGFADTAYGSGGIFSECIGSIEGYGSSSCEGQTAQYGGYGQTNIAEQTSTGSGYGYLPQTGAAGAAATYNQYGSGATATTCALSQNFGMTNCASGAYASANGAFAKTSLGSKRY